VSRGSSDLFPPHGLEDAHEFFRQGDDGDYGESEPDPFEDALLVDTESPVDLEHIKQRRARYARWVTGLMVALSLATILVFAGRANSEGDAKSGHTAAQSARRPQPGDKEPSKLGTHVASRIRVDSASGQDAPATSALVETQPLPATGPAPTASTPTSSALGSMTAPTSRAREAPSTAPTVTRPILTAVRPSKASRPSPVVATPASANSTSDKTQKPERLVPGELPRSLAPPGRSYSPPTARFED